MLMFTTCTFALPSLYAAAENGDSVVARALVAGGFEHVQSTWSHDTLFTGFENRAYRWEPRALAEALALLMPLAGDSATLSLTCLKNGIPVVTLVVTKRQYQALVARTLEAPAFADSVHSMISDVPYRNKLAHRPRLNSAFGKADITFAPLLRLQLGNFDHPLEMQFNIVPALQITFTKEIGRAHV